MTTQWCYDRSRRARSALRPLRSMIKPSTEKATATPSAKKLKPICFSVLGNRGQLALVAIEQSPIGGTRILKQSRSACPAAPRRVHSCRNLTRAVQSPRCRDTRDALYNYDGYVEDLAGIEPAGVPTWFGRQTGTSPARPGLKVECRSRSGGRKSVSSEECAGDVVSAWPCVRCGPLASLVPT